MKALTDLPIFFDIATKTEIWTKILRQKGMPKIAFFVKFCYFAEMQCFRKPWLQLLRKLRMYKSSLFYKIKVNLVEKSIPKKAFSKTGHMLQHVEHI